ncbi:MAG: hypothetical protein AAF514_11200 [Verrucomicrobiota bacterium]
MKRFSHSLCRSLACGLSLVLSVASLGLTSCQTTEEGLVTGALIGAALGGVAGHANERKYDRRGYRGYDGYRGYGRSSYESPYSRRYDRSNYGYNGGGYSRFHEPYCY